MIVLTKQQRDYLLNFLLQNRDKYPVWADIDPILIKNDLYILPEVTLSDPAFDEIKILLNGDLDGLTIREVDKTEFIKLERP